VAARCVPVSAPFQAAAARAHAGGYRGLQVQRCVVGIAELQFQILLITNCGEACAAVLEPENGRDQ
jgi:hypothetical protein